MKSLTLILGIFCLIAAVSSQDNCPVGQVYLDGNNGCSNPCSNQCGNGICTMDCQTGCYCPEGQKLDTRSSSCVPRDECPTETVTPQPESSCDEGLIYSDQSSGGCKNPCSDSCAYATGDRVCIAICVDGCYCPEGTVRSETGCVSPDQCPSSEPEASCDGGLVYSDGNESCTNPCVDSCEAFRGAQICTRECRTGCYCPEGRKFDSRSSSCVLEEQCPILAEEEEDEKSIIESLLEIIKNLLHLIGF